jgi:hypothetical protein
MRDRALLTKVVAANARFGAYRPDEWQIPLLVLRLLGGLNGCNRREAAQNDGGCSK